MNTSVKFIERPGGALAALEVRTPGSSSVMLELVRTLFRMRVEVLLAESHAVDSGRMERLHIREETGETLDEERRAELQQVVLDTIEQTLRGRRAELSRARSRAYQAADAAG